MAAPTQSAQAQAAAAARAQLATQQKQAVKDAKQALDLQNQDLALLQNELSLLNGIFNSRDRNAKQAEIAQKAQDARNAALDLELKKLDAITNKSSVAYTNQLKKVQSLKEENKEQDALIEKQKKSNELYEARKKLLIDNTKLEAAWIQGLMQSDKIIRQTTLNLGMSGLKADMIRTSFENSAMSVAEMGGGLEDLQSVMQGFADETGRSRVMSEKMLVNIVAIGKGTGLGVDNATKMASQFELMGIDAQKTYEMTDEFVHSSEKYGINTTKALKNVSDNFKKLNLYNFKGGVKGMMEMSAYATKMNIDFSQAFNAIDTAKTLEGAIELASNLQIMGGEFAKSDPFEMLFLSRNDPAKFTEKINDMTKGVVTFQKQADGTFTKFISPADRDRMASVEKSLGLQNGELTQQALRMADIMKMRKNMIGSGLSKDDKSAIEGAAIFNSKTGQFQVMVGTTAKNIANLTESEANAFIQQKAALEQRAKDALTFEEALQATLASFKTLLLPMLRGVNEVMKIVIPVFQDISHVIKSILNNPIGMAALKIAGVLTAAAVLINGGATALSKVVYYASGKQLFGGAGAGFAGTIGNSNKPSLPKGRGASVLNAGKASQMAGKGKMMAGAGFGAAAVGVGAGIGLAAFGISKLADSMAKLDSTKIWALPATVLAIGGAALMMSPAITAMGTAFSISIAAIGAASAATMPGLLALGATFAMIGGGIGAASAGIGYLAKGIADVMNAGSGGNISLDKVKLLSDSAPALERVGAAFREINTAMRGSADDYTAIATTVDAISKMNTKSGSAFAELVTLLKTPLKVEFADKEVSMKANITLDIDGERFTAKAINIPILVNRMKSYSGGMIGQ
jgi:hypothetical protein